MFKFKSKLIVALLLVVFAAFMSCEKENAINLKSNKDEIASLRMAGIEHNKGLDYVLQNLKASKKKGQLNLKSSVDIFSVVKEITKDFLKINSELINAENSSTAIEYAEYSFEWVKNYHSSKNLKNATSDLWDSSVDESLTLKQKELLSILNSAISNIELDLNATLEVFEKVRNRANNECSEEEQTAIIAAIEIGTNSMTYWNEHINEWADVLSTDLKSTKGWFDWKKVGGADVKGAVTGGVTGAITGAGAGIGALGGGVGASAGAAALELRNHWIN